MDQGVSSSISSPIAAANPQLPFEEVLFLQNQIKDLKLALEKFERQTKLLSERELEARIRANSFEEVVDKLLNKLT